jgi:hypothetical protein
VASGGAEESFVVTRLGRLATALDKLEEWEVFGLAHGIGGHESGVSAPVPVEVLRGKSAELTSSRGLRGHRDEQIESACAMAIVEERSGIMLAIGHRQGRRRAAGDDLGAEVEQLGSGFRDGASTGA